MNCSPFGVQAARRLRPFGFVFIGFGSAAGFTGDFGK
jgi:hypothetical protein